VYPSCRQTTHATSSPPFSHPRVRGQVRAGQGPQQVRGGTLAHTYCGHRRHMHASSTSVLCLHLTHVSVVVSPHACGPHSTSVLCLHLTHVRVVVSPHARPPLLVSAVSAPHARQCCGLTACARHPLHVSAVSAPHARQCCGLTACARPPPQCCTRTDPSARRRRRMVAFGSDQFLLPTHAPPLLRGASLSLSGPYSVWCLPAVVRSFLLQLGAHLLLCALCRLAGPCSACTRWTPVCSRRRRRRGLQAPARGRGALEPCVVWRCPRDAPWPRVPACCRVAVPHAHRTRDGM
jgi:hypothetical protein